MMMRPHIAPNFKRSIVLHVKSLKLNHAGTTGIAKGLGDCFLFSVRRDSAGEFCKPEAIRRIQSSKNQIPERNTNYLRVLKLNISV